MLAAGVEITGVVTAAADGINSHGSGPCKRTCECKHSRWSSGQCKMHSGNKFGCSLVCRMKLTYQHVDLRRLPHVAASSEAVPCHHHLFTLQSRMWIPNKCSFSGQCLYDCTCSVNPFPRAELMFGFITSRQNPAQPGIRKEVFVTNHQTPQESHLRCLEVKCEDSCDTCAYHIPASLPNPRLPEGFWVP